MQGAGVEKEKSRWFLFHSTGEACVLRSRLQSGGKAGYKCFNKHISMKSTKSDRLPTWVVQASRISEAKQCPPLLDFGWEDDKEVQGGYAETGNGQPPLNMPCLGNPPEIAVSQPPATPQQQRQQKGRPRGWRLTRPAILRISCLMHNAHLRLTHLLGVFVGASRRFVKGFSRHRRKPLQSDALC